MRSVDDIGSRLRITGATIVAIVVVVASAAAQASVAAHRSVSKQRQVETLPLVTAADGRSVDIIKLSYDQPVVIIRFLGSLCSHCMQQIVALNERASTFRTLNARVIAFSNNPPLKCAEVTRAYHIDTAVVTICSDTGNTCSQALGTTIVETDGSTTDLHAFLVIDKGLVLYEYYSASPLMSFQTVIDMLAAR